MILQTRATVLALALAFSVGGAFAAAASPEAVNTAIADANRPAADKNLDALRLPAEMLKFTGIGPGDKVVDLMPGGGYFTRLFSQVVGAGGKVYALQPTEMDKVAPGTTKSLNSFAGTPAYANVVLSLQPVGAISLPEKVDMVWTSLNYHDLHDPFMGSPDMAKFNRAVFDQLRPGGLFIILDHAAAAGTGVSKTNDLHRIEPAAVKAELAAAGFEFVGESEVLRNPADDRSGSVFAAALRGHTDRFVYKFRKP